MMNVISMIDDYAKTARDAKTTGAYEAYRQYTRRYPELFNGMFRYLYMTELENLRTIIESTNFSRLLATAKANVRSGFAGSIPSAALDTALQLRFFSRFTLYLGMGLGNIGGYSAPPGKGTPFVYFGLDRPLDEATVEALVPHELNHMVRLSALPGINMFDLMERTVSEGLASVCPIVIRRQEFKPGTYARALGLPLDSTMELMRNTQPLVRRLSSEFGRPLTRALMADHFTWTARGDRLGGYYAGMVIIKRLLDQGCRLAELTVMPSQKIWSLYRE